MKKSGRKKYTVLAALSLGAFIVLAGLFAFTVYTRRAEKTAASGLSALYTPLEEESREGDSAPGAENPNAIPARFQALYDINPELIGWLTVGDIVDEPVVYRDNNFYLTHGFDGTKSNSGTVFADVENSAYESDKYLVLYGHNIRGGGKFGPLSDYKELDFLKENPVFTWDTVRAGGNAGEYAVFGLFEASMLENSSDYFYLRRFAELRAGGNESAQKLIDEVQARSIIDIPLDVSPEDSIITLVTCSYSNADGRLLIFARKLREEETRADIARIASLAAAK